MSGFVYLIAPEAVLHRPDCDEGKLVKIGFTRSDPKKRLRTLQTGSPLHLKLWAYFNGTKELESALHETFAPLASHGEWFFALNKLECLLLWLGEEPHTGKFITDEQLGCAVSDTVFAQGTPHPRFDDKEWADSAQPQFIAGHFPDEWREALEWA